MDLVTPTDGAILARQGTASNLEATSCCLAAMDGYSEWLGRTWRRWELLRLPLEPLKLRVEASPCGSP